MKIQLSLALVSFVLFANVSCAQNSILAGKILDENKNPVAGAVISVAGKSPKIAREVKSDANGLYNISPLPTGTYKVTIADKNGKHVVKNLALDGAGDYYDFNLDGRRVAVSRSKEDPFLKPKLYDLRKKQWGVDIPVGAHRQAFIRVDSNVKAKDVYGENVPQSK